MLSLKKQSSYSWERSGVRKIQFEALKVGEKIGFSLGGEGHRREIMSIKEGTQSYWKGVSKGYVIVSVNGTKVDDITVKTALRDACQSGSAFTVGMSTGAPIEAVEKPSKSKAPRTSVKQERKAAPKESKKPAVVADDSKEEVVEQGYTDGKPIVDNGSFFYQDEIDVGGWFAGDQDAEYVPIGKR